MLSLKADFVCSICVKILKNPIGLPCGCTVCGEHRHAKTNQIKCVSCHIEYNVKENDFKPNKLVEKMLRLGVHLTDEEKTFKLQMEQAMSEISQLSAELSEKKPTLEVGIYDHFVELRRQIDIRREEAKARIDDISMQMIELTKQTETLCKESLNKFVCIEDDQLNEETKAIEEKFRDPNLLIESVKALKTNQTEQIARLRNQLSDVDNLMKLAKSNEFTAGLVFGSELFGTLNVVEP